MDASAPTHTGNATAGQFRKKYTVQPHWSAHRALTTRLGHLQVSEIDAGRRKTDRTLVFDEVDGVTNMQALARWVRSLN